MRGGLLTTVWAAALLLAAWASISHAAEPPLPARYVVTDLGSLGGDDSRAHALNNRGQVVGVARTSDGYDHAFLYDGGEMRDLGTLGGTYSVAYGINELGQVVGAAHRADQRPTAFLYRRGQMLDIGGLPGSTESRAFSINLAGEVVGASLVAFEEGQNQVYQAFCYRLGQVSSIEAAGHALHVNDLGQVVGVRGATGVADPRESASTGYPSFAWRNHRSRELPGLSNAFSIANNGWIAGMTANGHAALSRDGQPRDLGTLPGTSPTATSTSGALALNERGQVVGWDHSFDGRRETERPFLWDQGAMWDLNALVVGDSEWRVETATDINELGQVVGVGHSGGRTHALLLSPASTDRRGPAGVGGGG